MQKVKIPITIDPTRAAQKRMSFVGYVPLSNLTRLTESLTDSSGDVDVSVHCGTDEQGLVYLEGNADVQVHVTCERCGDPMAMALTCSFAYTPVHGDDSAHDDIPQRYDVVEKNEHGEVNLRQLVEDELILALPLFPTHEEGQCDPAKLQMTWGEIEPEPEKPNPFAVLQELKKK